LSIIGRPPHETRAPDLPGAPATVLHATADAAEAGQRPFKLDGVVQRISCPFMMLHGEGDEQIPLTEAKKCFDAVGSKQKTMKIFTREEGGYHHCQIDNQSICSAYM
jgi:esterase/lipase